MRKLNTLLLFAALFSVCCIANAKVKQPKAKVKAQTSFAITNGNFVYNGKPVKLYSGEMHYARIPAPYWRHRLKMMKAMGLNAVATYVFWNHHEIAPGKWDWTTDNRNLREYIKIAGEEGLMVVLRPGPYVCAEWEFGGYPWWLQKTDGMVVRTDNKPFLDSCQVYINQLANQVRDLQITKGGPIIMVQAENEFGSYVAQRKDIPLEVHKKYSHTIKQQLIDAGFDIPMFTSDGSWLFEGGSINGALPTGNGENNVDKLKQVVNQYHDGVGPYMVMEYYSGWLDHWKEPFQKVSTQTLLNQTKKYLDNGVHFNFYMIHGGTNFGFTSGANYTDATNIQPDITSYDYDAPISEAGWATDKYMALRNLLKQHVGYKVPEVPAKIPVIAIPQIKLNKTVDVFSMIKGIKPVEANQPMTFEDLGQGHGYVLYRRHFNQPISGTLDVPGLADYALVYVNGTKVGELNRVDNKFSIEIDIPFNATLDILVENMGRINYGPRITQNLKGITQPVTMAGNPLDGGWKMYQLPMNEVPQVDKLSAGYKAGLPVIYSGTFNLSEVGDTFLDMEKWGKGIVFVNGFNLGRYWKVGPQHTLYLPGCFLKKGENKIVIFEQQNDTKQTKVQGLTTPLLDKLVEARVE